jgi:hypothetical protein
MKDFPPKFIGRTAVSPAEAAEIASVHPSTFYRHHYPFVRSGKIQSFKVGSRRCIVVSSYLAFLEQEANHGT